MAKQAMDDFFASGGSTMELFSKAVPLAEYVAKLGLSADNEDRSGPYEATPEGIIFHKQTGSGTARVRISNCVGRIVTEIECDDGVEVSRQLEIELRIRDAQKKIVIPARDFANLNWVIEKGGAQARIYAGTGNKDRFRDAVQALSTNIVKRTEYACTGWVLINGTWQYLHGGGSIGGSSEIVVVLPPQLAAFNIPPASREEIVAGMRASLGLLGLAPDRVMVPLLCSALRAPLGQVDFGINVDGPTGLLKSELAAITLQHFGRDFSSRGLPSWTSTSNFLQGLSFTVKDALLVIDDLLSTSVSFVERQKQLAAADSIFRGLGNNSARGRMRADTSLRPTKPTRSLIVSTAEERPQGQSLLARLFNISVSAADTGREVMNFERLSEAQRMAANGMLAHAMRGYLENLAPRYGTVRQELRYWVNEYRDKAIREIGRCHARTPAMIGDLYVGAKTFLDIAIEYDAISTDQASEYALRIWSALVEGAAEQSRSLAAQEPAHRFLELVMAAVSAGRAYLTPLVAPQVSEEASPKQYTWRYGHEANGLRVVWFDGDDVYLDPDVSYKVAREMAVDGSGFLVSLETLKRRLKDQGLLASTDSNTSRQSICVRRTVEGLRREVLHLFASTLGSVTPELDASEFSDKM
jgi:hypothetical protein